MLNRRELLEALLAVTACGLMPPVVTKLTDDPEEAAPITTWPSPRAVLTDDVIDIKVNIDPFADPRPHCTNVKVMTSNGQLLTRGCVEKRFINFGLTGVNPPRIVILESDSRCGPWVLAKEMQHAIPSGW